MSTLTIHPVEYLKLHLHYEEIQTRLLSSLGLVVKKVSNSLGQTAISAVFLLTVGLVMFGLMKIADSASVAASYDAAITEMVVPLY